jgi:hypothetical protein
MRLTAGGGVIVVAVVFAAIASGHGGGGDARDIKAFDVYYAGKRVLGLALQDVEVSADGRDSEVVVNYGRCVSVGGGACSYQLQLDVTSMCRTHPGIYYSPPNLEPVNGAQGGWIRTAHYYDVYTGSTAISIFSVSRKEAHRVAKRLVNIRPSERGDRLPPPREKLLKGHGRCQRGPVAQGLSAAPAS